MFTGAENRRCRVVYHYLSGISTRLNFHLFHMSQMIHTCVCLCFQAMHYSNEDIELGFHQQCWKFQKYSSFMNLQDDHELDSAGVHQVQRAVLCINCCSEALRLRQRKAFLAHMRPCIHLTIQGNLLLDNRRFVFAHL